MSLFQQGLNEGWASRDGWINQRLGKKIKERNMKQNEKRLIKSQDECGICLFDNNDTSLVLDCNHVFHQECILGYCRSLNGYEAYINNPHRLAANNPCMCPTCRSPVNVRGRRGNIIRALNNHINRLNTTILTDQREMFTPIEMAGIAAIYRRNQQQFGAKLSKGRVLRSLKSDLRILQKLK